MQHGVIAHEDSKAGCLVARVEAEVVAVVRHGGPDIADRKRGNGSVQAGGSTTIGTRH
jgi:hypothetical protein